MINIIIILLLSLSINYCVKLDKLNKLLDPNNEGDPAAVTIDPEDMVGSFKINMPAEMNEYDERTYNAAEGSTILVNSTILPSTFDWTDRNNNWMKKSVIEGPIQEQRKCGKCWAVAAATVMEAYLCINTNICGRIDTDIVAGCSKAKNSGNNNGCDGNNPVIALHFLRLGFNLQRSLYYNNKTFIPTIAPTRSINTPPTEWRYTPPTPRPRTEAPEIIPSFNITCPKAIDPNSNITSSLPKTSIFKVNMNFTGDQLTNQLKKYLYSYGPAIVKVDGRTIAKELKNGPMAEFKSRIQDNRMCSKAAEHSVVLIGWTIFASEEYWILRNSWGQQWGVDGNFYTKINGDICNVGRNAVFLANYNIAEANRDPMNPSDYDVKNTWFTRASNSKTPKDRDVK